MDKLKRSPNQLIIAGLIVYALSRLVKSTGYEPVVKIMDVIAIILIVYAEVLYFKNRKKK